MKKGNTTILRFEIEIAATSFTLDLPIGAELVDIANDGSREGRLQAWFAASPNPKTKREARAFARTDTGQEIPFNEAELTWVGRATGLGSSKSHPGQMTPRTVHFFEATGEAREQIIALSEAFAETAE